MDGRTKLATVRGSDTLLSVFQLKWLADPTPSYFTCEGRHFICDTIVMDVFRRGFSGRILRIDPHFTMHGGRPDTRRSPTMFISPTVRKRVPTTVEQRSDCVMRSTELNDRFVQSRVETGAETPVTVSGGPGGAATPQAPSPRPRVVLTAAPSFMPHHLVPQRMLRRQAQVV